MFCTQRKSLNCMKLQASFAVNESRKTSSRFAATIRLGLSATIRQMLIFQIVNETCKLTAGKIACWTKSIFVCCRQWPMTNTALLFVYKPNSRKFNTQKNSQKKYPRFKIPAYCICNKETRLQKGRKNMLKDKFAFIDEATKTAIRNEQDELRMHGATRTLQTLCSSLPSGINAERERFRKMPMQR